MRTRFLSTLVVLAVLLAGAVPAAHAALERVGPVTAATGGYPAWYQDTTGLGMEFCMPINQAELNGGWCTILPVDVPNGAAPETPFTNFSEEHFYWIATAGVRTGGQLVLALEGAFSVGPAIAGDQIVFGRLRITHTSLPATGDYKVYTPFGDFDFPGLTAGDRLFFTSDIGINCAGFECVLNSQVGPFLLPSATPGGAEVPPIPDLVAGQDPWHDILINTGTTTPYPATGKKYIADPARIGTVTGSPLPPFVGNDGVTYNHNVFRIEGPGGSVVIHEENFAMGGRVMANALPGRVTVNRASYAASATGNKLDVFATATHTVQGRLPAAPVPSASVPDLGYYDAPCATDPVTGAVTGPPVAAAGGAAPLQYFQMFNDGVSNWWGQNAPAVIPAQVCVQDLNARNATGAVVPAYFLGDVSDAVHINWANVMWDPASNGGTLTVSAASSDTVNQPVLTLSGYTVPFTDPVTGVVTQVPAVLTGGSVVVSPLGAPPAKVTVASTRGGVASLDTTTGVGTPVSSTVPVANADSVTTPEDTAVTVAVLANDTLNGGALPAGATVTITAAPRLGSASVNPLDQTISYTPNPNANGTDIVGYTVTVGTAVSPEGYLTVIITPVNDVPVANNDTAGAPNNRAVTINVLANDTDPDGAADLAAAVIVTAPAASATLTCNGGAAATVGTVCAGGSVTFTPTATGSFTFTYKAQDQVGAQSANAATVTVTVGATEAIVVTKSQYIVSKNRWVVTGTDSVRASQTLTLAYTGGTYKVAGACTGNAAGSVVGTAPVDALGNWVFDAILTSAGLLNPGNTGGNSTGFWCTTPKAISVTSPLGGTATANIILK